MYIEKRHDMVDVKCCHLGGVGIDESEIDNALVIGFDGGVFTVEEGQTAEITTDEETVALCTVGDEKCIFNKCILSVHNRRVILDVWNDDDNVGLYLMNVDSEKLSNVFFGIRNKGDE